ncbi:hypothetical protein [Ferrovibrio sp.]|uniref:hypothetical protein n=1 Tax=Ferrovibrio sp. TaxID=1917215 RepID=UPI0035AE0F62
MSTKATKAIDVRAAFNKGVHVLIGMSDVPARMETIAQRASISHHEVSLRMAALRKAGLVERERAQVYWLSAKGKRELDKLRRHDAEKPDRDSLEQRLWNALRQAPQRHSLEHLLTLASRPDDTNAAARASAWLGHLQGTGIVVQLPGNANFPARWRLLEDIGPLAPVWREALGVLFDWNRRQALQQEAGL